MNDIILYNGDCLDILPKLTDKVNAVICDIPYGSTACKWDIVIPYKEMWKCLDNVCYINTPIILFGNEPFSSSLRLSNLKMYKYDWIYEKSHATGHLNAKKMPMRCHENISIFYKKTPLYTPQFTHNHKLIVSQTVYIHENDGNHIYGKERRNTNYNSSSRYPRDIQFFKSENKKTLLHPTQKPLKLIEYLIKTYSKEGDIILDFCMGSGTTGIACQNLKRKFIGIEKDLKYFMIAKNRLNENAHKPLQQRFIPD